MTTSILCDDIRARLDTHRVITSVSGGKDSAAACLHLKEQGIPYDAVFMDTGWEHADTYTYLGGELAEAVGPIRWLRAEVALPPEREVMAQELEAMLGHYSAMVRHSLRKGMFPMRTRRWCTEETKLLPMQRWLRTLDSDTVSVVGIRAAESEARSKLDEWEWSAAMDSWTWRPIMHWSLDDVIAIHSRHGLRPNPLYLRGADRVGCWPCIFARKSEVRMIAETDPTRIAVLKRLEEMMAPITKDMMERHGKGDRFQTPSWFKSHGTDGDRNFAWPIDRVVEWARTARGGKQVELFASTNRDAGCLRWGLCDTGEPPAR